MVNILRIICRILDLFAVLFNKLWRKCSALSYKLLGYYISHKKGGEDNG